MKYSIWLYFNVSLYYDFWKKQVKEKGLSILKESAYFADEDKILACINDDTFTPEDEDYWSVEYFFKEKYSELLGMIEDCFDGMFENYSTEVGLSGLYEGDDSNYIEEFFDYNYYYYVNFETKKIERIKEKFDEINLIIIPIKKFSWNAKNLFTPPLDVKKIENEIFKKFPKFENCSDLEKEIFYKCFCIS